MTTTLGCYRLIEQIGAGGMGVVYRAHDPRLQRDVAIKVLPAGMLSDPAARKRFHKEALAISKLNHPGIATVHDVGTDQGTDYMVMELVPGTTLDELVSSGPLPDPQVAELGLQIAEALTAAHEQHIVHRDLKPGNLRLTPDGRVKILDFGLARSLQAPTGLSATETFIDSEGASGTLPYMAPEQLRSEPADPRTDIWATGAVLYELATARRPFEATSTAAIAGDILHRQPTPPRHLRDWLSPGLEAVILKCLQKDPALRYQSARDLALELKRLLAGGATAAARDRRYLAPLTVGIAILALAAVLIYWGRSTNEPSASPKRVLAVMPLQNLSGDSEQDYFVEGLTDALVTDLSRIPALKVIARGSVARYREQGKTAADLARDLGIDAVVEGSVLRSGDQVRINARLIDPASSRHLWAGSYQRSLTDILNLQADVAKAIAGEIRVQLSPQEQQGFAPRRGVDPETHEAYLRGRFFWNKRGLADLQKAITYFEQAIANDPTYAPAYSGLADSYLSLYDYGHFSAADISAKVRSAARRALELDPTLAEAHNSLAHLELHDWAWPEAEKEFKRAIELDPGYVPAYHWYALCLTAMGRTAEAISIMEQARGLDPLSLRINADVGMAMLAGGRYDDAIAQEQKTLELDPNFRVAYWIRGMAYQQKGLVREAEQSYKEALQRSPGNPNYLAALANLYATAGRQPEARQILRQMHAMNRKGEVSPFFFALVYAGLGETEAALDWLEKAYQERSGSIRYLKVEPRLNPVKHTPRYRELMKKVGLE